VVVDREPARLRFADPEGMGHEVYFREPGGVLYELATLDGAGFAVDEEPELMGRRLGLPPFLESERDRIEPALTPLPDPSIWRPEPAAARS
jgi:glyoxalase family protein